MKIIKFSYLFICCHFTQCVYFVGQSARFPRGGDPEHVQREAVADVRPLGPLLREHVLLRRGEGDIRPQTDELPRTLVTLHTYIPLRSSMAPRSVRSASDRGS
jgi:hypothetical protein